MEEAFDLLRLIARGDEVVDNSKEEDDDDNEQRRGEVVAAVAEYGPRRDDDRQSEVFEIRDDDGVGSSMGEDDSSSMLITKNQTAVEESSQTGCTESIISSVSSRGGRRRRRRRRPILVCDAYYGFPTQKGPRRERINAVGRQIVNFLNWRDGMSSKMIASHSSHSSHRGGPSCRVSFLGNVDDVDAVRKRMYELVLPRCANDDGGAGARVRTNADADASIAAADVEFRSDSTMRDFLDDERRAAVDDYEDDDIYTGGGAVYLSPDATRTLSCDSPPPRIVVIGMLIDRNTRTNRSLSRAEGTLMMNAAKLPLDVLKVRGLSSREPLNVDTVMELMQRWHWNCDGRMMMEEEEKWRRGDGTTTKGGCGREATYRVCFLEAAAFAMKSQRERHPNRTIHGS